MSATHFTQWAAQFAVASELCKRGYQVALTLGNHPALDIMAVSPNGVRLDVEVKGVKSARDEWFVKPIEPREGLYYVLVIVEPVTEKRNAPNRFFVMTQQEVNAAIDRFRAEAAGRKWIDGVTQDEAEPHENKWKEKLPP
jgi:hypothetical protein